MRFPVPVRSTIIALAILAAAAAQEPLPPGEVLRAALEAQVKGDVEGMLAHFALDRYSTEAVAASRKMLAKAAELASFEDFELTIRAVSVGESGQMAVVRAQMSFIMNAPEYRAPATEGVLAVLLKSGDSWKLGSINPDPLLDEELRAPAEEIPMGKGRAPRAAQPVGIKELNEQLDKALNGTHLNDNKLAADMLFAHIGKIPGAGDAAANIYQIANVVYDTKETASNFWNHGFTRVGFLNAAQVAVGVAQIVTEQLPGPDTVTDLVAMHLSQMTTNAEVRRGLEQLRPYLRGADATFNPVMLLLPEGAFRYPDGMIKATDGGEEAHPMGQLVFALVFESPDALGKPIPFVLSGHVTVPDDMGPLAKKLGGVNTAAGWRIPLDVTPMIAGPASAGPPVLQRFRIDRSQAGAPPLAVWTATCVPGRQEMGVRLVNGETTRSVQVRNAYMAGINALEITGVPGTGDVLNLKVGQVHDGIRVFGKGADGGSKPELTAQKECLNISCNRAELLSLRRDDTIALRGEKAGSALVSFDLNYVTPSVSKTLGVTVQDNDSKFLGWLKNTRVMVAKVDADAICKTVETGATGPCALSFDNTVFNSGLAPVQWTGDAFTIKGTVNSPVSGACEVEAAGRFSAADNTMSGSFRTSCKFKQGAGERELISEFALDSLPPLLDMVPEREGIAYVFTLNANHGHAVPLIKSRARIVKYYEMQKGFGPPTTTKNFVSVNWENASRPPSIQISLMK